ncbi:hypothetical protein AFERRI_600004 [Acidithiobacillus ferrivorans]|uniref:Uncharacterized protein n=1 Tax=Acidithiobacillus ferrivorans TaxID=160808 RepID=A0A060UYI2_9PROT|nr:hypothetical protein AFERRI_600004 [Acidithiobacillus ferrivorans]
MPAHTPFLKLLQGWWRLEKVDLNRIKGFPNARGKGPCELFGDLEDANHLLHPSIERAYGVDSESDQEVWPCVILLQLKQRWIFFLFSQQPGWHWPTSVWCIPTRPGRPNRPNSILDARFLILMRR